MMLFDLSFSFHGWDVKTSVTDSIAAIGFILIAMGSLFFYGSHRRMLNQRLHTVVDGNKLFEKLKYDMRINGNLAGIDRLKLYKNEDYARTVFKSAMEYNERDFVWYFNERTAKIQIWGAISRHAWSIFGIWLLFIVVMLIGVQLNLLDWLWDMRNMNSSSGIVPIWILFIFTLFFHGILKWREYANVKKTINDDVRRINLDKKGRVWSDFIIIFWSCIGVECLGLIFIFINIFF